MNADAGQVIEIPYRDIEPYPDNPNEMSALKMKALKEEIELRGFMQPVLVRPHPDHPEKGYQIIDGEHRWRILGELGYDMVPCVIDHDADDTDADARRITMNRFRGVMQPIRLAHLLNDLRETIPESELAARQGLERSDLQDLFDLASFLDEPDEGGTPGPGGAKTPDDRVELVFVATQGQAKRVEALLDTLTGGDPEREAAVLSRVARNWE